jgi:hypothetical protein
MRDNKQFIDVSMLLGRTQDARGELRRKRKEKERKGKERKG